MMESSLKPEPIGVLNHLNRHSINRSNDNLSPDICLMADIHGVGHKRGETFSDLRARTC